jgi:poly(hydroxyalkanoate) granule-associated protein
MSDQNTTPTLLDLPKTLYDRARSVRDDAVATGREAWLTGLGAVGVIEDEGAKLVDAVVARQAELAKKGKTVETRGRARFETVRAKADIDGRRRAVAHRVEASVVEPIVGTLQRLGLPSRAEMTELSTKVDVLTRRVNALIAALEKASPAHPVFAVKAREEGWAVVQEGVDAPVAVHATKDEALEKGRALASEQAPSQLVVYRKDGTIQDTIEYAA